MSNTLTSTSLATRAKRLTALARAKKENETESQTVGQVQTALNKLELELGKLERVVGVHKRLKETGVPSTEIEGLMEAPEKLQTQIETVGRPTAQFLNVRTRDVTRARSDIDEGNLQAWHIWASQRVEELPLTLLPRVPFYRRSETTTRVANLRRLAGGTPTIADIIQFQQSYNRVKEDLDSVEVATIDEVLKRFKGGRIRLADLSDAELEMLRDDDALSDQLYLHLSP